MCQGLANLSGDCSSSVCREAGSLLSASVATIALVAVAILCDILDVVCYFKMRNSVRLKTGLNLVSCLLKWTGFGVLISYRSTGLLRLIADNRCFDAAGQALLVTAEALLYTSLSLIVVSACLSLIAASLSAFYGGHFARMPIIR